MQNQERINRRGRFAFAEFEIEGRRECPRCHAPFTPHLGNLIATTFQCRSCKTNLSFRSRSGNEVKCPSCNFFRPVPNSLTMVACGGCEATVIYQRGDRAVKCCFCKHITNPTEAAFGFLPPLQVNRVDPPPVHPIFPPLVNRMNGRTNSETTASTGSSSITQMFETPYTIVADLPDAPADSPDAPAAESVAQIVINVALRTEKREAEEDKTEAETESKKIRRR